VIGPAEIAAFVMLAALLVYAILAGADFGGGLWDLFARGPRKAAQRKLIESAIAPVWEANHVWLIVIVVMAFVCFPTAFSAVSIALHIPITIMLVGIVFRGSAFVFRSYGAGERVRKRWGRVFAIASVVTPIFLGVILGAITDGEIRVANGVPTTGFFHPWLQLFPFTVGLFALALFAMLAAVFLTNEADDDALREDFRARALGAAVAVGIFALGAALAGGPGARNLVRHLLGAWWSWPLQIATGVAAIGVFVTLGARRYALARVLAIAQVTLIIGGWALAQYPYLIAPDVTIRNAAAPDAVVRPILWAFAAGAVILVPSVYYLFRVFKMRRRRG